LECPGGFRSNHYQASVLENNVGLYCVCRNIPVALRGYIFWRTWKLRKGKSLLELQVTEEPGRLKNRKRNVPAKEELQTTLENLRKTQDQ